MSTANRDIHERRIITNIRLANTGVGITDWIVFPKGGADNLSVQVEASATAVISIEATINVDIDEATDVVPAAEINAISGLTALAANSLEIVQGPVKAVRINQTAGVGTSAITVLRTEGV